MIVKMYVFEDPTGGGDDIVLMAPATWEVPGVLQLRDSEGEPYEFQGTHEEYEVAATSVYDFLPKGGE